MRSTSLMSGGTNDVDISVQGAFTDGRRAGGEFRDADERVGSDQHLHLHTRHHTFKWGGRVRGADQESTSVANFGGTFTFTGGSGPELDANNNADCRDLDRAQRARGVPAARCCSSSKA